MKKNTHRFNCFFINNFFSDERTKKQYINIFFSFLFKGISFLSTFIFIPICLSYLSSDDYGLWITIYSILSWTTFMDFGLGNGLKNKLSTALAYNDFALAKKLVSTAYIVIFIIVMLAICIFLLLNKMINWNNVLNTGSSSVSVIVLYCFVLFFLKQIFDLINSVLHANQNIKLVNFISTLSSILVIVITYFCFKYFNSNKLLTVAFVTSFIPLITSVIFNFLLFSGKYKNISPSVKCFRKYLVGDILFLGSKFFLIQIIVLLVFSTDNLLISRLFSPSDVSIYNSIYKLFSIFSIIWILFLTPYWTAFNEAYVKKELDWIKKTMNSLVKILATLIFLSFVLLLFCKPIFEMWIGQKLEFEHKLSIAVFLLSVVTMVGNYFSYFLNGLGKVKVQLYTAMFSGIINIPVCILLSKYTNLGVSSVVFGTALSWLLNPIFGFIQYKKIIQQTAKGIWDK